MAKKSTKPAARRQAAGGAAFDDKKYGRTLFSATFDYSELTLARAAELLGNGVKNALTGCAFATLLAMIIVILVDDSLFVLVGILFVASFALIMVTSRWSSLQVRYARTTTLAAPASAERRHVAVGEKSVHVENEAGELGCYDLSDLRAVHSTSEFLVADFGQKRYVYVPRSALSENRYRDLVRFLNEKSK